MDNDLYDDEYPSDGEFMLSLIVVIFLICIGPVGWIILLLG